MRLRYAGSDKTNERKADMQQIVHWAGVMLTILATAIRAAVIAIPLVLLALSLLFATAVAILRPTRQRQAMVDRLNHAITSVSAVIVSQTPNDQDRISGVR